MAFGSCSPHGQAGEGPGVDMGGERQGATVESGLQWESLRDSFGGPLMDHAPSFWLGLGKGGVLTFQVRPS